MQINRKFVVMAVLTVAATISIAGIKPFRSKSEYTNLQVLPKDISTKALQHIMVDQFQDGLGVGCSFCHAQEKGSLHLDYASDEKPEKEIARAMMRMTTEINKKYFEVSRPIIGDSLIVVSCNTCHHGVTHPDPNE
jgi:hypothetical protein